MENNVNRLLNMSQDYDKSYLDEEIKAIQSARKVSIQQRMENRKEKDK